MLFQTGPVDIEDVVNVDTVTGWDFFTAFLIFSISVIVALVLKRIITRQLESLENMSDALSTLIVRGVGYLIMLVGLLMAAPYLGFQIEPLMILLIIGGLLLFFAGRPLMEDFSAGLILQTRSPFIVGDLIQHEDHVGTVTDIDGRETVLTTVDGEVVRIPNTLILKEPMVNLTSEGARRTTIEVGVEYGVDLDHVAAVLENAVVDVPTVLETPAPSVGVVSYGDSSINFDVRIWHRPPLLAAFNARDDAIRSIDRALKSEGITIPFPQRDVWMRSDESPGDE